MGNTDLTNMDHDKFGCLEDAKRIWAIGAIHGEIEQLRSLHQKIKHKFQHGDRLVYLGNYFGNRPTTVEVLDELLLTRRYLMAFGKTSKPNAFVYLRGAKEEMFSKLLQLQYAPNPSEVMDWLLDHDMGSIVDSYGTEPHVARAIAREGTISISRWTSALRRKINDNMGHSKLLSNLRRAAFTSDGKLLFVHASVDTSRPLTMQKDNFWWDNGRFEEINSSYSGFARIIGGYDHSNKGISLNNPHIATIDGGCGRGNTLNAVCFSPSGDIMDHLFASGAA